jgi:cardiolipin synthase
LWTGRLRPGLAAAWLAWAVLRASGGEADGAGRRRVVAENARPLPGLSTEAYPEIGPEQAIQVLREAIGSSLLTLVRRPLSASTQVVGRSAERLAVRGRELATRFGPVGSLNPFGRPGDGALDAPIGSPRMAATLTLLPTSESAVRALLELIATATRRVDLMIYGWEDDPTGREVASALEAAAGRGVVVRLLVDRGGFLIHNRAAALGRPTFLDRLRSVPGVILIEPPDPFLRFDHRKLVVVDGRTAWTGGMILTEVARRRWENLAFLAEGPVASEYAALFEDRWRAVGGARFGPVVLSPSRPSPPPNATARLIRTDVHDRSLKDALFHAIDHARHHIYLENPYFSDELLAGKLVAARRRGVDVRVVVTLRGNVRLMNRFVVLTANRLLRGGVRVYLAPTMTHVKAMTADGVWSYLGTGNFDELSLRGNREVGLSVVSPGVAQALESAVFLPDLARAEELTALMPLPKHWPLLKLFALWY